MKYRFVTLIAATILAGCSTTFQGIKVRAQAPTIEEAFRKFSLATTVDGYEIEQIDPAKFSLETKWRELKDKEKSATDTKLDSLSMKCRVLVKMQPRGKLYDVLVTPMLLYTTGTQREVAAPVNHPLWEKLQRVLNTLVQRESKEED